MNYFRTRSLHYFDWLHLLLVITIATIGLLFIFSATYTPEIPLSIFLIKQIFGVISGIMIYFLCSFMNPRKLLRVSYFAYHFLILVLIFTLIKGSIGMGGQRWVNLGLFKLQPSELAKIWFPAFCVYHTEYGTHTGMAFIEIFTPLITVIIASFLLVAKQPDLGTACIILFVGLSLFWFNNIGKKFFITLGIGCIIGAPILWHCLRPYQKNRVLVFLGYGDTKKERYQTEQAAIAIGSGGFMGKGFLQGTQNKLHFLPESRTDFIFAVIGEEWGFLGALLIIILYILLFSRSYYMIATIPHHHMQLLASGLIIPTLFSTIINIGMVLNLLPIVGIPLPLISYGLSHLWVTFASLGWLQGIAMRERM